MDVQVDCLDTVAERLKIVAEVGGVDPNVRNDVVENLDVRGVAVATSGVLHAIPGR
nr:hypothetical protein [Mycobacterium marinum]